MDTAWGVKMWLQRRLCIACTLVDSSFIKLVLGLQLHACTVQKCCACRSCLYHTYCLGAGCIKSNATAPSVYWVWKSGVGVTWHEAGKIFLSELVVTLTHPIQATECQSFLHRAHSAQMWF